jgi:phytoene/squalene synthetase
VPVTRPMRDGDHADRPHATDDARHATGARGAAEGHGASEVGDTGNPHDTLAHDSDGARSAGGPRSTASTADSDVTPRMLSSSRYLAWLYSPETQQPVLAKLCEIEGEIAGSLRPGIDHHVAHARLQWWQEECDRCVQGRPVHPLTRELVKAYGAPAVAGQPSPLAGISGFADTAVWDLAGATFETRKELTAYCERWAAAMFETAAAQVTIAASDSSSAAKPGSPTAPSAAQGVETQHMARTTAWRALGAAVREIELLTDLAREAHAGRVRVPLDELDRAGVEVNSLAKPPWPAPLAKLLSERHQALRAAIAQSVGALGRDEQTAFRGLLVWAALAWRQSERAQRALPGIIFPRRYHALADGWQAWRAARRAAAGKLRLG